MPQRDHCSWGKILNGSYGELFLLVFLIKSNVSYVYTMAVQTLVISGSMNKQSYYLSPELSLTEPVRHKTTAQLSHLIYPT